MESKGIGDSSDYQTMDTPWSEEEFLWKDRELDEKSRRFGAPSQTGGGHGETKYPNKLLNNLQRSLSSIKDGNLQQSNMESEAISDSESCDDQIVDFP